MDFQNEDEARAALAHVNALTANTSYEWFMSVLYHDMEREVESFISESHSDIRVRILQGKVQKGREVNERLEVVRDDAIEYLQQFK